MRAEASSHTPSVPSFRGIAIYLPIEKPKPPRRSIQEPERRCEWKVLAPLAMAEEQLFIVDLERLGSR
jgi:hypothetical protein